MGDAWKTIALAGKTIAIFEPAGTRRPVFGILHLADDDRAPPQNTDALSALLAELNLACVCPMGPGFWWTDRIHPGFHEGMSSESFLMSQVVPFFKDRWNLAAPAIGVQGIGSGGQAALRLAFKHAQAFPVVGAMSPALDYYELYGQGTSLDQLYDSKEHCRQDTALMHIHPAHYPAAIFFGVDSSDQAWYRGNDRLHEKLTALGVTHEFEVTSQGSIETPAYFKARAERLERFMARGLLAQSRRLL